ncbi:MAG: SBBP repeat-containing protein [candidate division WOR-3 bacterium]|nr:SBBP repeat-containing protein [candidate division WOR-3 bacterium]
MKRSFQKIFLVIFLVTLSPGQEWVRRYDGPASDFDVGLDLAFDQFGNCYVTGYSTNHSFNYDYATLKYSNSGIERWVRRYNGTGNGYDVARVIRINHQNQIFVAGGSYGFGTNLDFLNIRYDTSGNVIWMRRFDGGANLADEIFDLTTDNFGYLYLTGYATDSNYQHCALTIKYDTSGTMVWSRRYSGPPTINNVGLKIKLDNWNNVYVAGYGNDTSGWYDYFVLRYDSSGNRVWVANYNGTANRNDYLKDLAIDTLGNVYVTGYSEGEDSNFDCATVKFDASGNQGWEERYNGTANQDDRGYRIVLDQNQNVYVVGFSDGIGTAHDFITLKYDTAGNERWQRRYNGPGNGDDVAKALAVDDEGNCYVAGHGYFGPVNTDDYMTIKYDSVGNLVAERNYNGTSSGYDEPNQLRLDQNRNIFLTGESGGLNTSADFTTIKYQTLGIEENQPSKIKFEELVLPNTLILKQNQLSLLLQNFEITKFGISMFDIAGRQIRSQLIKAKHGLNLFGLNSGIYFLIIEADSLVKIIKLVLID